LRERSAGEWSGLTRAEIDEAWPGYLDDHRRPPGFEPDDMLLARTLEGLAHIETEYRGGEILVVTHGGVVYALESDSGLPFSRLPNLGARWLRHDGERVHLGERLALVDEPSGDGRPGPAAATASVSAQGARSDDGRADDERI
jgi:hypothetical protein